MSKRIITLLFIVLSSSSFAQNIEGLELEHFATRTRAIHAQYLRYTYKYYGLPILEHQRLEVKTLDGEHLKTKSSLKDGALSALNSKFPKGPYLVWRNNSWLSVRPDTTNNGIDHYVRLYNSSNEIVDEINLNLHFNDDGSSTRIQPRSSYP